MWRTSGVFLAAMAACARTPPAPPATVPEDPDPQPVASPAPQNAALLVAAAEADRCPDAPNRRWSPDAGAYDPIRFVALAGRTAYGLAGSGRIHQWDGVHPPRELGPAPFVALAADGSVAMAHVRDKGAMRLEVWELASNRPIHRLALSETAGVYAVSASGAVLRTFLPPVRCEGRFKDDCEHFAWREPVSETQWWHFASGERRATSWDDCKGGFVHLGVAMDGVGISADGKRVACVSGLSDLVGLHSPDTPRWSDGVRPGRDWQPPPDPEWIEYMQHPLLRDTIRDHWVRITSMLLAPGGDDVFVSYRAYYDSSLAKRGIPVHRGWRLERWSYDPAAPHDWKPTRLATDPESLCVSVLAVSGVGELAVMGGPRHPLTVRRAPRYEPEPLAGEGAVDAAVSADGGRILTGHADGRMRIWDARTGALIASSND